ncbi:hypothetical protein ACFIOY_33055 [Bradyrhizobium sp. TZ2]
MTAAGRRATPCCGFGRYDQRGDRFFAGAAAVLGGVGTIAIALLWMKLFPALRKVERLE